MALHSRTTRVLARTLSAAGMTAAAVAAPLAATGTASAAPAQHASAAHQPSKAQQSSAPSACRPANYQATISQGRPSMGSRHYRVTLKAAPGYADCTLQGFPRDVVFSHGNGPAGVSTTHETGQSTTPVTFGPGHPVHFDVKTPSGPGGAPVDGASFLLPAPGAVIPGSGYATAAAPVRVGQGTQIGAIHPGP
jgi:hypothetical protein